ncbi:right-handed parallel beta-helix repeat-containing protein [Martelella mediterranea]|uniref:Parallel beta helix pectate lyase-like protein n=1 Tax=Martelella mediterranea TaxID=293089 RepID=A0A4R3NIZ2_9HYPH|nr:right-handed parallel beta-helix repeat-containing protein [Martelella mediterranea]TCT34658.1 hypothetical protein EDC90_103352 [Martelella mediterranea]
MSTVLPIEDKPRWAIYTAADGQVTFAIPFVFQAAIDVSVFIEVDDSWEKITSGYTITGAENPIGGSVTFSSGRAPGDRILVLGAALLERVLSIVRSGRFSSKAIDDDFDRLLLIVQELDRDRQRSIKSEYGEDGLTLAAGIGDERALIKRGAKLEAGPLIDEIENAQGYALDAKENQERSKKAAIVAAGSMTTVIDPQFSNLATAQAYSPVIAPDYIRTAGYSASGDGGGAMYKKAASEPAHAGKLSITLDDAVTVVWYELAELKPTPLMFGAVDDGTSTDDTDAFDGLSSYCEENGIPGYIPATSTGLATNGNHTFSYGLIGEGNWRSKVFVTHATNDVIIGSDFYGGNYVGVYYFASVTRTNGATIKIDNSVLPNNYSLATVVRNNVFQNGFIDIQFLRCNAGSVEGNRSFDFAYCFCVLGNVDFPDNGDYSISGNVWDTGVSGAYAGILQLQAGGARIVNNKGGRADFGYVLQMQSDDDTSILIISNNSFENHNVGNIRLTRDTGITGEFRHVIITGNEFAGVVSPNACLELDFGLADFITNVVVTDNVIQFTNVAISVDQAKNIRISDNVFESFDGSSVGVQTSNAATGLVGYNVFSNVTTPYANTAAGVTVIS